MLSKNSKPLKFRSLGYVTVFNHEASAAHLRIANQTNNCSLDVARTSKAGCLNW